jgi:hypothetical protein
MRRNEGGFSSKLLHRRRCRPFNNHPVVVLFGSVIVIQTREAQY